MIEYPKFLAMLVLAISLGFCGCDSAGTDTAVQRDIGTVSLEINYGNGKQPESIDVVCSPDSTVLSTLERAQNMNKLKVKFRGNGETAFVTSIGGVEDGGDDGNHWIYRVNGKLGDKGGGVFAVDPGDAISWTYGDPPDDLK
jgi:hypothetical protein